MYLQLCEYRYIFDIYKLILRENVNSFLVSLYSCTDYQRVEEKKTAADHEIPIYSEEITNVKHMKYCVPSSVGFRHIQLSNYYSDF